MFTDPGRCLMLPNTCSMARAKLFVETYLLSITEREVEPFASAVRLTLHIETVLT
jgi:hypothetical protein